MSEDTKRATDPSSSLSAIILAICFVLALGVSGILTYRWIRFEYLGEAEKLEFLWERDLKKLESDGKLPEFWSQIRSYKLFGGTDLAKEWVKNVKPPIRLNPQGTHHIEILILSFQEKDRLGAIVQYDAIEIQSKNLVWEIGRTFLIKGKAFDSVTKKATQPTQMTKEGPSNF